MRASSATLAEQSSFAPSAENTLYLWNMRPATTLGIYALAEEDVLYLPGKMYATSTIGICTLPP